jgi:hypothetical protein
MKSHETQLNNLINEIETFRNANGVSALAQFQDNAKILLTWVSRLNTYFRTGVADELLLAVASSIRESAAFAAIGAVRPCLFSLRAQTDLLLSWLYFKDHPVEYETLKRTGDGFILKKEALKYFSDNFSNFSTKFAALNQIANRQESDPYRLLSAHIHSQSPFVISSTNNLQDVIRPIAMVNECSKIQYDVSEYLGDILFSSEVCSFTSLPESLRAHYTSRAKTPGQRKVIFG